MKISDLWIGDQILLKKSGRKGRFEGINSKGKLMVNVQGKIILTNPQNVELITEDYDNTPEEVEFPDPVKTKNKSLPETNSFVIDLHLEKLDPQHNIPAIRALDFQIEKCKTFLEKSISKKFHRIIIIHGKGSGILKTSIKNLLKEYQEVYFTFDINNGGATEVWLQ